MSTCCCLLHPNVIWVKGQRMTVCCNSRMLLLPFLSAGMLAFSRNQTWSCSVTHCSDCTTAYPVPLLTPLSLARVHLSSPPLTRLCPPLLTPSLACVHISSSPLTCLCPRLLTPLSLAGVHLSSPPLTRSCPPCSSRTSPLRAWSTRWRAPSCTSLAPRTTSTR